MSNLYQINRRTFVKMLAQLSALTSSFSIKLTARATIDQQTEKANSYGYGIYGESKYSGYTTYLPTIRKGEN